MQINKTINKSKVMTGTSPERSIRETVKLISQNVKVICQSVGHFFFQYVDNCIFFSDLNLLHTQ